MVQTTTPRYCGLIGQDCTKAEVPGKGGNRREYKAYYALFTPVVTLSSRHRTSLTLR